MQVLIELLSGVDYPEHLVTVINDMSTVKCRMVKSIM